MEVGAWLSLKTEHEPDGQSELVCLRDNPDGGESECDSEYREMHYCLTH